MLEQLLGHADVGTTAYIYVQGSPARSSKEAAEGLGDRLRTEALLVLEAHEGGGATLDAIVTHLRNRIAAREPSGQEDNPDIEIVTLWGAKGLTADYTFIVGLCDEALPGRYDPDATGLTPGEHELEQQRLLYVSLTRAGKALVLSRPTKIRRGEVPALGLQRGSGPNRWWQELTKCRLMRNLPADSLPSSVDGAAWPGLELDT